MGNDLIVGAWREGLEEPSVVQDIEKRRRQGFRLLPTDRTIADLADLLDAYDEWALEMLTEPTRNENVTVLLNRREPGSSFLWADAHDESA